MRLTQASEASRTARWLKNKGSEDTEQRMHCVARNLYRISEKLVASGEGTWGPGWEADSLALHALLPA